MMAPVQEAGAETHSPNCLIADNINRINDGLCLKTRTNLISQLTMDAKYFLERGQQLAIANKRQEAIIELTKAISLEPNYIEAYWYRSNVFASINQPEAAIVDAEKAADLFKIQGELSKAQVMLDLANDIREGIKAGDFNP
jgi:tetratricopeptide (TPR) repeat protein